jgi:hypothetical protein
MPQDILHLLSSYVSAAAALTVYIGILGVAGFLLP